jgi:predicted dehydrogenase
MQGWYNFMVRLALVGTLDEAARYARVVSRIRGAQLAAVVDRTARTARGSIQNVEIVAEDFETLLANHSTAFDAVIIHGDLRDSLTNCRRAAVAGKHILLQQLLAFSAQDAAEVVATCTGIRLMAGHSLHFLPEVQAIHKSLMAGQLGEPGLLRMHCWEPASRKSEPSTDRISDRLTSAIDLAIWLFGQTPSHTHTTARVPVGGAPAEYEYLQAHLGFDRGGMAIIDHARNLPRGGGYRSITLIGSKGAAYVDDHNNSQLLYRGGRPVALPADESESQLLANLQEFVAAITENREPLACGADALRAIQATEALIKLLATPKVSRRANENAADSMKARHLLQRVEL